MSSVSNAGANATSRTVDDSSIGTTTSSNAASTLALRGPAPAQPIGAAEQAGRAVDLSGDQYAASLPERGDRTQSRPPIVEEQRPADYKKNLQGATAALAPLATAASVSPVAMQLLMAETSAKEQKSAKTSLEADQKATSSANKRSEVAARQADSIVASTNESTKDACKTNYTNHDANVAKMQKLGFDSRAAEAIIRTLQDGRTASDVKAKIAFQLAAIGMTGSDSQTVGKAIATNARQIKNDLAKFGDQQADKFKHDSAAMALAGPFAPLVEDRVGRTMGETGDAIKSMHAAEFGDRARAADAATSGPKHAHGHSPVATDQSAPDPLDADDGLAAAAEAPVASTVRGPASDAHVATSAVAGAAFKVAQQELLLA